MASFLVITVALFAMTFVGMHLPGWVAYAQAPSKAPAPPAAPAPAKPATAPQQSAPAADAQTQRLDALLNKLDALIERLSPNAGRQITELPINLNSEELLKMMREAERTAADFQKLTTEEFLKPQQLELKNQMADVERQLRLLQATIDSKR